MHTVSRRAALAAMAAAPIGFAGPSTARPAAIDEQGFISIGGIDQWVAIQGDDARNPAILYLHGGPGEAQSPFLKTFRPWERRFTVINWDQRGAGRTYGRNGPSTPDVTLTRMADDAIEIAEHARARLGKRKLILVGQSWGAILGLTTMKRRPDLFYAFVGTGQPVSWALTVQDQERWARLQASGAGDVAALKALDAAASLPLDDFRRLSASARWKMSPSDLEYLKLQTDFIGRPPYPTTGDVADWIAGGGFSGAKLWTTITSFDARKLGLDMPIPFFVVEGRDDHVTPFAVARAYVAEVRAPEKAFIPVDGGHFACFTDAAAFTAALESRVRPLAGS